MRILKNISFFIPTLLVLFLPSLLFAGGLVPCDGPECTICDIAGLAQRLINYMVMIAASVAALLFAYAGILYVTAGGDSGKVSSAHKIFFNVFVGFMLILAAWLFVDLVMVALLDKNFLSDWHTIPGC